MENMKTENTPKVAEGGKIPSPEDQATQVNALMKQDSKEMKEGSKWCYVTRKWLSQWINYTQSKAFWELEPDDKAMKAAPGPMENDELLTTVSGPYPVQEISRDLQNQRDYFCVPEAVFELFNGWYHGGPKITRVARKYNTGMMGEVKVVKYPIHVIIIETGKDGKPDDGTAFRKEFAPMDTLKDVKTAALEGDVTGAMEDLKLEETKADDTDEPAKESKEEIRLWIPVQAEDEGGVAELEAEDPDKGPTEPKFSVVVEAQEGMELGTFNFKNDRAMILLERKVEGKWVRKTDDETDDDSTDWKATLKVGDKIDALDTVNAWLVATVKDIKKEEQKILIHYDGYETRWDEWLELDSERLAKKGTKKTKARATSSYTSSYSYYSGSEGTPIAPGIVGLRNLGNTCFMNSTLQSMNQTPWLTDYLMDKQHEKDLNKENPLGHNGRIAEEFGSLIGKIWSEKYTVVAPRSFKEAIGEFAPQFRGYSQQDSQELLAFLLDGLHEDLNRLTKKEYDPNPVESEGKSDSVLADLSWKKHLKRHDSAILDNMGGLFRSKVTCPECKSVFRKFDPFLMTIPVPLPSSDEKRQEVTVVFFDHAKSPCKYIVEAPKFGEIMELKKKLSGVSGVPAEALIVAEVFHNKIYKVYDDEDKIASIMARDVIYAFECPAAAKAKQYSVIPVVQVAKGSYDYREFGEPRLIAIGKDKGDDVSTYELKIELAKILRPFVKEFTPHSESKYKGIPYTIHFKNSWGQSKGQDIMEEKEGATVDVGQRDVVFAVNWGTEKEAETTYQTPPVVDDASVNKSGSGKAKGGLALDDCLKAFTKEEQLKKGNEYYCSKCKKHLRVTKKMDVYRLPNVMAIQLKRFQYTSAWRDKISTFVDFPLEGLDMAPHTLDEEEKKNAIYDLYAISCHGGGLGGGHYWAYVKNRVDGKWYNCNDSSVSEMSKDTLKTSEAYLLFYARRGFGTAKKRDWASLKKEQ
mmetsp:Transcript_29401/g.71655  ORF Transcript_29401/g.71655 Transcript_29401/m.71655 type:complete len:974 (+) Transcript_29401:210-3131(+)|eukprot:CAMPEP_0114507132 /NCGR_PEP_ID=MMETSP0109-20121206/11840_1 /TAXON_ID=29199 /ORGANISM="Chlorarachnion reptans, Strain CCCM449" /LENGTH=973 /DNA_ID=CAMNT_0001685851 /DNA_START=181 /DNA_END=3102 /DNA_ORIENTATION=+